MKKHIIIAIVLIGAVLLTAPVFVGNIAERKFNALIAQSASYDLSVSSRYARSWFSADAETMVHATDSMLKTVPQYIIDQVPFITGIVIKTTHSIHHGPFSFSRLVGHHSPLNPVIATIENTSRIFLPRDVSSEPLTFQTYALIHLDGRYDTYLDIPGGLHSITTDVPLVISYDPVSVATYLSPDLKESLYAAALPRVTVHHGSNRLICDTMVLSGAVRSGVYDLQFGSNRFSLSRLVIHDSADDIADMCLSNLIISTQTLEQDHLVYWTTTAMLDFLSTDGIAYGPGYCSLAVRNIDAASLPKLRSILQRAQSAQWDEQHAMANSFMLYTQVMSLLPRVLSKSPEIELHDVSFVSPEGIFTGSLLLSAQGITEDMVLTTTELFNALDATASFSLPATVLDPLLGAGEPGLSPLAPFAGLLNKTGNVYQLNARLTRGVLSINDTVIPLPFGNGRN